LKGCRPGTGKNTGRLKKKGGGERTGCAQDDPFQKEKEQSVPKLVISGKKREGGDADNLPPRRHEKRLGSVGGEKSGKEAVHFYLDGGTGKKKYVH